MTVCKFLDAVQINLHVADNITVPPRITAETKQIQFKANYATSSVSKQKLNSQSVKKKTNFSNSEVIVIESIEVREVFRFYVLLENLNEFCSNS